MAAMDEDHIDHGENPRLVPHGLTERLYRRAAGDEAGGEAGCPDPMRGMSSPFAMSGRTAWSAPPAKYR